MLMFQKPLASRCSTEKYLEPKLERALTLKGPGYASQSHGSGHASGHSTEAAAVGTSVGRFAKTVGAADGAPGPWSSSGTQQ